MENIILYEKPELREPFLIVGFSGWPNAAEISTQTVNYLVRKLRARKFAEIKPEEFYVFTTNRPVTDAEAGLIKSLKFPATEFYFHRWGEKDLIFLLGQEPDLKWKQYAETVFNFVAQWGVRRIYTIGGEYAQVPHTKPTRIWIVVSEERLKKEISFERQGIEYQGPTSIHTYFLMLCKERGMECIGLWGDAPHYIQIPNPVAGYWMLKKVTEIIPIGIDLEEVRQAAIAFDYQIDKALAQSTEMQSYVRRLEEIYEKGERHKEVMEGDIVKEAEEFLRRLQEQQGEESA